MTNPKPQLQEEKCTDRLAHYPVGKELKRRKDQPQKWEKRILDACAGDPIAVTMLVICKEEREKAIQEERESWLNQSANQHDQKIRAHEREEVIRECIDSIKKMSWASWRAEEVLNNLLKK